VDIEARESAAVEDDSVPLYDREFALGSTPLGDSSNIDRYEVFFNVESIRGSPHC